MTSYVYTILQVQCKKNLFFLGPFWRKRGFSAIFFTWCKNNNLFTEIMTKNLMIGQQKNMQKVQNGFLHETKILNRVFLVSTSYRQKYVLKNIHTVVFKLLSIYTTTKKNQFDCLECEKKVQRKSITFVLQFCSKTQQEAIVRLISLNFFLRTETKMISTFSHHHFPLLYISRELKKPQKVFFPPYYSKTFVVTFLKYKIDPQGLLTQHDLFRTRKIGVSI